jgi:carbamoyltransferase
MLLNTSFNVDGEPIVESPEDAIRCFGSTLIDALVLGDWVLTKRPLADLGRARA